MIRKILIFIINILIIINLVPIQVYADSTVNLLEIKNFDIDISNQYSIKPIFNLTSASLNSSYETEIYIIKNGSCIAYLPFSSTYTGTNTDSFLKPDDSSYTDSINFYLQDMDYSVFVYKYTLEGDNVIDSTTVITKEDAFDVTTNIEYSTTNIVNKNFNNNSINEDFTCFYTGDSGKTLYIQFVNKFPEKLDTITSSCSFDFQSLDLSLNIPNDFSYEDATYILADDSNVKYLMFFQNIGTDSPFVYEILDGNFDSITLEDVNIDSINKFCCSFKVSANQYKYYYDDTVKCILNGRNINSPISDSYDLLDFINNLSDPYPPIDLNSNYEGFILNDDDTISIQMYIEKGGSTPTNDSPVESNENKHIVLNTGVN